MVHNLKHSYKCNNNCLVCPVFDYKTKKDIEKSTQEIFNEISASNELTIRLPCNTDIRSDFFEILAFVKKTGKKLILITNGRAFYYSTFCEKLLEFNDIIETVIVNSFGNGAVESNFNTQTKEGFEEMKIGYNNLIKYGFNPKLKTIFSPILLESYNFSDPIELIIEVTQRCNLRCGSCFNLSGFRTNLSGFRNTSTNSSNTSTNTSDNSINAFQNKEISPGGCKLRSELSTNEIKSIIDTAYDMAIPKIRFSGGEPLLRSDIFELIRYAHEKGLMVWLNTNATVVNLDIIKKIENYVENVLVPINGYDEKSDSDWTGTNTFYNKLNGLDILKNSKIKTVRAGTVLTPQNIINLEKIFALVKKYQLPYWELYRPIPTSIEEHKKLNLDGQLLSTLIEKISRLSLEYGKLIQIANAIPFCAIGSENGNINENMERMNLVCTGSQYDDGHSRMVVDYAGFIKPSYFLKENIGSYTEISESWDSDFLKNMRSLAYVPTECISCKYLEKCKGGSRYVAKLINGSYDEKDPMMNI